MTSNRFWCVLNFNHVVQYPIGYLLITFVRGHANLNYGTFFINLFSTQKQCWRLRPTPPHPNGRGKDFALSPPRYLFEGEKTYVVKGGSGQVGVLAVPMHDILLYPHLVTSFSFFFFFKWILRVIVWSYYYLFLF